MLYEIFVKDNIQLEECEKIHQSIQLKQVYAACNER